MAPDYRDPWLNAVTPPAEDREAFARALQGLPFCPCHRCRMRRVTGPVVLIVLGVLFLVGNFTSFGFERSWPILLIVIGAAKILARSAPTTGHVPLSWRTAASARSAPTSPGQAPPRSGAADHSGEIKNG